MELKEFLNNLLYAVLTVAVPVLLSEIVPFIKAQVEKSNLITEVTKNEWLNSVINEAISNIMDSVLYVNQTYVDSLKNRGEFNKESQKEAFTLAYNEAIKLISEEAKEVISKTYGSLDEWIHMQIEIAVNNAKK